MVNIKNMILDELREYQNESSLYKGFTLMKSIIDKNYVYATNPV